MDYLIHHAIDRSAERYPDRPAFRFLDTTLDYRALVDRANRLANLLSAQGVSRGDRVGIYMHKCIESPVALYGIMKAGAAYVPLDPSAPVSRLRALIEHCGIRCLVTHALKEQQLMELLSAPTPLEVIVGTELEDQSSVRTLAWTELDAFNGGQSPGPGTIGSDLAYIMYTSGSTGVPKGIMHTHASGLSYARMAAATYDINHEDRLSNHSPLHFDMSTFDYFSGPLCGACTVIIPEAYTKLPASLASLIESERLTVWYSVPFALIQLLLHGMIEQRDLSRLRWVLFGGEPFPAKYLQSLRQLWTDARFSNVYGPAEVNQCTFYHVPAGTEPVEEPLPIGRVWNNARGLVVDRQDRPVQEGESGELLVSTPTMMRAYWNQPELNSGAFYRHETAGGVPEVYYRTGDLVRDKGDGVLVFLGRKDRQIKVRGYRVELDEIETVLAAHGSVQEAAAYRIADAQGNDGIQAAVIPADSSDENLASALKQHCEDSLPWYAVPADILLAGEFPRTTSGKIDRRALKNQWAGSGELELKS